MCKVARLIQSFSVWFLEKAGKTILPIIDIMPSSGITKAIAMLYSPNSAAEQSLAITKTSALL